MKALISGSNGFIGTHIRRLLSYDFVPVPQDLLYSPDKLSEFMEKEKPDYIFHLAAYGNHSTQKNPAMTVFSNIIGTFNMLHASLKVPYTKFIQFGSSSEYGSHDFPMKESDICDPRTFYGSSKLSATYLARTFAQEYAKPIIIIRPFSVYGEGEADFRFIPTIIRSLITNQPMTLDTEAKHDWIYIEDFISGMEIAMENAKNGEIVNVGTGREVSNIYVVNALQNVTGLKLAFEEGKMRPNDSVNWSADITKLLRWGWKAKFPMGIGLGKTFQWYKVNER